MSQAGPPGNRRAHNRAPIELRVEYKRVNIFFADYTRNISKGGTFIRTEHPLSVGTEFVFSLVVPSFEQPLRLVGRVMWNVSAEHASATRPAGMGIEFVYSSAEEQRRTAAIVEQAMREELGAAVAEGLLAGDPDGK